MCRDPGTSKRSPDSRRVPVTPGSEPEPSIQSAKATVSVCAITSASGRSMVTSSTWETSRSGPATGGCGVSMKPAGS